MFFKVTNDWERSLYGEHFPAFSVQYSAQYFAKPRIGKLFCYNFDCIRNDDDRAYFPEYTTDSDRTARLWVCECANPEYKADVSVYSIYSVQSRLLAGELPNKLYSYGSLVQAVLADEIRLVRRIDLKELNELYTEYKKGM